MSKKATERGEGSKKKKKSRGECVVSKEEGGVGTDLDLAHTLYTMPVLLLIFLSVAVAPFRVKSSKGGVRPLPCPKGVCGPPPLLLQSGAVSVLHHHHLALPLFSYIDNNSMRSSLSLLWEFVMLSAPSAGGKKESFG